MDQRSPGPPWDTASPLKYGGAALGSLKEYAWESSVPSRDSISFCSCCQSASAPSNPPCICFAISGQSKQEAFAPSLSDQRPGKVISLRSASEQPRTQESCHISQSIEQRYALPPPPPPLPIVIAPVAAPSPQLQPHSQAHSLPLPHTKQNRNAADKSAVRALDSASESGGSTSSVSTGYTELYQQRKIASAAPYSNTHDVEMLQARISQQQEEIIALQDRVNEMNPAIRSSAAKQLKKHAEQLDKANKRLAAKESELTSALNENAKLIAQNQELREAAERAASREKQALQFERKTRAQLQSALHGQKEAKVQSEQHIQIAEGLKSDLEALKAEAVKLLNRKVAKDREVFRLQKRVSELCDKIDEADSATTNNEVSVSSLTLQLQVLTDENALLKKQLSKYEAAAAGGSHREFISQLMEAESIELQHEQAQVIAENKRLQKLLEHERQEVKKEREARLAVEEEKHLLEEEAQMMASMLCGQSAEDEYLQTSEEWRKIGQELLRSLSKSADAKAKNARDDCDSSASGSALSVSSRVDDGPDGLEQLVDGVDGRADGFESRPAEMQSEAPRADAITSENDWFPFGPGAAKNSDRPQDQAQSSDVNSSMPPSPDFSLILGHPASPMPTNLSSTRMQQGINGSAEAASTGANSFASTLDYHSDAVGEGHVGPNFGLRDGKNKGPMLSAPVKPRPGVPSLRFASPSLEKAGSAPVSLGRHPSNLPRAPSSNSMEQPNRLRSSPKRANSLARREALQEYMLERQSRSMGGTPRPLSRAGSGSPSVRSIAHRRSVSLQLKAVASRLET